MGLTASAGLMGFMPGTLNSALADGTKTLQRPPNVIILLADDQGWGDLGCYGHPVLKTPAIDRLATEGCRFTNFYVTAPVCSPSRAGLMTGRIQNRFGMQHILNEGDKGIPLFHHVPPEEPSIARQLRGAGYATAHIGKWHMSFMGHEGEPTFDDYGFDESLMLGAGRYTGYYDSFWTRNNKERFKAEGRWSAEVYIDEAIAFIDKNKNRPFFMNVWSFTPHIQVDCAQRYKDMYPGRTEEEQVYFGAITQMDENYGRLLDYLDREGLADNTIVIFSSDNGCTSPILPWVERSRGRSPLSGSKHNLYETGIRVPGIVRWPGQSEPGRVSHVPVSTLDLLPTLCTAAGVDPPADFPLDGGDFRPALMGQPVERPHALYWQYPYQQHLQDRWGEPIYTASLAVRDGSWKLLTNENFNHPELYNLDTDPSEKWNMADKYPEIAQRLLDRLKAIHADVNGPYSQTANNINPKIVQKARRE